MSPSRRPPITSPVSAQESVRATTPLTLSFCHYPDEGFMKIQTIYLGQSYIWKFGTCLLMPLSWAFFTWESMGIDWLLDLASGGHLRNYSRYNIYLVLEAAAWCHCYKRKY